MPDLKLDRFLPYRLSIASNRVSAAIATAYQRLFALRIPEWRLVAVLAEGGAMTQQALGRATQMDKVTVSRASLALVERGLVARAPHEGDRRSHRLALTATGRALYAQVAPKALELEAAVFDVLTAGERVALTDMLDRVAVAADRIGARED